MPETLRVIGYVDGFNLYFGLRASGLRHCYWLNVQALAENLLRTNQTLTKTKYFTARISGGNAYKSRKRKRQSDYLEALGTLSDLDMLEGQFLSKPITCRNCGSNWSTFEEKMTDVQISTQMMDDAFDDLFDVALIVSADSDLVPPMRSIRRRFPNKRLIVCFPPGRNSVELKKASHSSLKIPIPTLESSVFPDEVEKSDGYILKRPAKWQ